VDDRARRLLDRLGSSVEEACGPREALLARLCAREAESPAQLEARLTQAFAPELAQLGERLREVDPGFARPLERTERGMRKAVAKLAARYGRALAQADRTTVERVQRLQALLLPEGAPQERIHALPYYACRFGTQGFKGQVLERLGPLAWERLGALEELRP
jgi:hypothetical protein